MIQINSSETMYSFYMKYTYIITFRNKLHLSGCEYYSTLNSTTQIYFIHNILQTLFTIQTRHGLLLLPDFWQKGALLPDVLKQAVGQLKLLLWVSRHTSPWLLSVWFSSKAHEHCAENVFSEIGKNGIRYQIHDLSGLNYILNVENII